MPVQNLSEYSGDRLRDVAIAFIVLELVFVSLRFLSKVVGRVSFGIDDIFVILGLLFCLGLNADGLISITTGGMGHHLLALEPKRIIAWLKNIAPYMMLWNLGICFSKLAILVFYVRIFTIGFARIATFVLIGLTVAYTIALTVAIPLQCIPLQYLWDKSLDGHCYNIVAGYRWGLLPSILLDVPMLVLPIPSIWSLHAPVKVKIGVIATLMTGSLGMIVAIYRLVSFLKIDIHVDGTWSAVGLNMWAIVETGCYLIAACLICCRPLLKLATESLTSIREPTKPSAAIRSDPTFRRTSTSTANIPLAPRVHKACTSPPVRRDNGFSRIDDEEMLVGVARPELSAGFSRS